MLTPFDTLVDAVVNYSGFTTPGSAVYKARNPGALKAFSPTTPKDEHGNRVFKSSADGMQALRFDLEHKIGGKSKRRCSTLEELAAAYDLKPTTARTWALFIRRALGDDTVSPKTPLTFFKEQK